MTINYETVDEDVIEVQYDEYVIASIDIGPSFAPDKVVVTYGEGWELQETFDSLDDAKQWLEKIKDELLP